MTLANDIVDLSQAQNPAQIDWARFAKTPVRGAIVRTGYALKEDTQAGAHASALKSIWRHFGTYHYPIPTADLRDAGRQAELMVQRWKDLGATLAPAADWEATAKESPLVAAIQNGESGAADALADFIDAFMTRADELLGGACRAIMYTGSWFNFLPRARAAKHRDRGLWVASYTRPLPSIPWPWDEPILWQHSANTIWKLPDGSQAWGPKKPHPEARVIAEPGVVDGIPGEVDCNMIGRAKLDDLRKGIQPQSPLDLADVRDRQRALRRLGYDVGGLDGQWGKRSKKGLERAQIDFGLRVDGAWSDAVAAAIRRALDTGARAGTP